jgi:hypothetical protein
VPAGLAFTLPHGVRVGGEWTRDVRLRALSGAEEEFLAGHGAELLPAERTTELLARCVVRIGPLEAAPETVLGLTVGDREALLLQIRRLTFGDRLDAVVACPSAECGERMDLELSVRDLLVEPYSNETDWQEASVEAGKLRHTIRYRVPTGADQVAAARMAADLPAAARLVLDRCVRAVVEGEPEPLAEVPEELAEALTGLLASGDPQAELVLSLTCPVCGAGFRVLFDAGDYLFRELGAREDGLYDEVHQLALHYHWSEAEIMAMPTGKRRRYLELLTAALPHGD